MTLVRLAVLSSLLLTAAAQAAPARYLSLINRAHDSIVAVEVAAAGSDAFEPRPIDAIDGGGGSTTVRLGDRGCRFDLRLRFKDARVVIYREVDVCRGDTLVITPAPRAT